MSAAALEPALLEAFVAVADRRSFTAAAAALNRTQSAVSLQVKRLESRLGVALFMRTTTRVALTPAGESLLEFARRLLSLGDEAVGHLKSSSIEGRVRLGVMEDLASTLMPPLLASFGRAYPRVQVAMETGLTRGMPDRLGIDFDIVIAMHPGNERGGRLLRVEDAIWVAGQHADFDPDEPLPLAVAPPGCLFREWAIEALERAGRSWRIAFVSQSHSALLAVLAEGLAAGVLKAGLRPPNLRMMPPAEGWPALPTAQIRLHAAPQLSVSAKRLAEHLIAGLTKPSSRSRPSPYG